MGLARWDWAVLAAIAASQGARQSSEGEMEQHVWPGRRGIGRVRKHDVGLGVREG